MHIFQIRLSFLLSVTKVVGMMQNKLESLLDLHAFLVIVHAYLFAVLPVTDDIKSLKVRNIPLSATNFVAASDFGYW